MFFIGNDTPNDGRKRLFRVKMDLYYRSLSHEFARGSQLEL